MRCGSYYYFYSFYQGNSQTTTWPVNMVLNLFVVKDDLSNYILYDISTVMKAWL